MDKSMRACVDEIVIKSKGGLIMMDCAGLILRVNSAAEKNIGNPEAKILGKNIKELLDHKLTNLGDYPLDGGENTDYVNKVVRDKKGNSCLALFSFGILRERWGGGGVCVCMVESSRGASDIQNVNRFTMLWSSMYRILTGLMHRMGNNVNAQTWHSDMLVDESSRIKGEVACLSKDLKKVLKESQKKSGDLIMIAQCLANLDAKVQLIEGFVGKQIPEWTEIISRRGREVVELVEIQQRLTRANYEPVSFRAQDAFDEANKFEGGNFSRSGIELKASFCKELKEIKLPYEPFVQMLVHLLRNSRESIQKIRKEQSEYKGEIIVNISPTGKNNIKLFIKDNGSGLSPDQLRHLFHFDYSTKEGSGDGFGLYFVSDFVSSVGGNIEVSSKGENFGVEFLVQLPREIKLN